MRFVKYFADGIIELLLLLSYPLKFLVSFLLPFRILNRKQTQGVSIILVEHWFSQNIYHYFLKKYLEKKGYRVYLFNSSLLRNSIEKGAAELRSFLKRKEIENCILVGISIGGVTSYYYVQNYGWEGIQKVLCVGAPFKGSFALGMLYFLRVGRQLWPGSNFIKTLFSKEIVNSQKIVSIVAKYDEWVPRSSSTITHVKTVEVDIFGHNYLHIASKETFQKIAREIESD